jgi:hypothetical protein
MKSEKKIGQLLRKKKNICSFFALLKKKSEECGER